MFTSIFGQASVNSAASNFFGNSYNQTGLANQYQGGLQNQQAMMGAYNQYAEQRIAKWMIDGEVCSGVKDFAKRLYPDDEQAQLMIVLKFGDV